MAKNMRGTIFDVEPAGPDRPIRLGVINIDGVPVNIAVYPQETSAQTMRTYNPVKLSYPIGSPKVLRAEPVEHNDL